MEVILWPRWLESCIPSLRIELIEGKATKPDGTDQQGGQYLTSVEHSNPSLSR